MKIMKKERIICVLMLMFALILSTSCSKDEEKDLGISTNKEESNKSTPTNNDNYYVKYEVLNGVQISYATKMERTVTCKDVNKTITVQVTSVPWEATYGPFKKGDKVYMIFSSSGKFNSICRLRVSKNKEAFAIKDELSYVTNGKLEYTIDY